MITYERLIELLSYDPTTGIFTWLVDRGSARAGREAGVVKGEGYLEIGIDNSSYSAHRLAWLYMTGEWPPNEIDHRNTIKTDNVWENLRKATRSQNQANLPPSIKNTSGFKGVVWHARSQKWQAQIKIGAKCAYLGLFPTKEEAAAAYAAAATKQFGEFARIT